jgi:hypothetical protein
MQGYKITQLGYPLPESASPCFCRLFPVLRSISGRFPQDFQARSRPEAAQFRICATQVPNTSPNSPLTFSRVCDTLRSSQFSFQAPVIGAFFIFSLKN